MKINIYTDGSCINGNPGQGGYAFIIYHNNKEISRKQGSSRYSTNQREELKAIIEALKSLQKDVFTKYDISIFTDSQYCKNIATRWINNWKQNSWRNSSGKQIKNIDLVKQLYEILQTHKNIKWNWVKGHSTNKKNNLVDSLAVEAAKKQL